MPACANKAQLVASLRIRRQSLKKLVAAPKSDNTDGPAKTVELKPEIGRGGIHEGSSPSSSGGSAPTDTGSSPDGPGRVRQILAIEFVELGSGPSREGREHVRGVEFGTGVGPDRITKILGVEAVQGS